jgi:hypothetical protein
MYRFSYRLEKFGPLTRSQPTIDELQNEEGPENHILEIIPSEFFCPSAAIPGTVPFYEAVRKIRKPNIGVDGYTGNSVLKTRRNFLKYEDPIPPAKTFDEFIESMAGVFDQRKRRSKSALPILKLLYEVFDEVPSMLHFLVNKTIRITQNQ